GLHPAGVTAVAFADGGELVVSAGGPPPPNDPRPPAQRSLLNILRWSANTNGKAFLAPGHTMVKIQQKDRLSSALYPPLDRHFKAWRSVIALSLRRTHMASARNPPFQLPIRLVL
ncbi:MAG: hypothetical protein AAGJ82_13520, partial [Bacteroidota bacterium]